MCVVRPGQDRLKGLSSSGPAADEIGARLRVIGSWWIKPDSLGRLPVRAHPDGLLRGRQGGDGSRPPFCCGPGAEDASRGIPFHVFGMVFQSPRPSKAAARVLPFSVSKEMRHPLIRARVLAVLIRKAKIRPKGEEGPADFAMVFRTVSQVFGASAPAPQSEGWLCLGTRHGAYLQVGGNDFRPSAQPDGAGGPGCAGCQVGAGRPCHRQKSRHIAGIKLSGF